MGLSCVKYLQIFCGLKIKQSGLIDKKLTGAKIWFAKKLN